LIEKDSRQSPAPCRAFSFCGCCNSYVLQWLPQSGTISYRTSTWRPAFLRYAGCRTYRRYARRRAYDAGGVRAAMMAVLLVLTFEIAIAAAIRRSTLLQGYPVPMSKKKRACVVTYRHSEDRWFENAIP